MTIPRTLAAFLALVTAMGVTVWLIATSSRTTPPLAESIPSDAIAFFSNVAAEDLETALPLFPILRALPLFDGRADIALVELPGGQSAWAMLKISEHGRAEGATLISSEEFRPLLAGERDRLAGFSPFLTLQARSAAGAPSAFLDLAHLLSPSSPPLDRALLNLGLRYALLERGEGGWTLHAFDPKAQPAMLSGPPRPVDLSPPAAFGLSLDRPMDAASALPRALSADDGNVLRSLLATEARKLLGPEVSLTEDLLPLFDRASLFQFSPGTGGTLFLWRGATDDLARFERASARLLQGAPATGAAPRITRRTFDRGFASTTIRSDASQSEELRDDRDGWAIRGRARSGEDRGIFLAARGREFLVANSRAWMEQAIAAGDATPLPSERGLLALGTVDLAALRMALAATPLSPTGSVLPFLRRAEGSADWSLSRTGAVWTLTVGVR